MRTPRDPRALLTVLVTAAALVVPAGLPAAAQDPVGGPRLGGIEPVGGGPATPPLPPVTAASYVVADLDTGQVLAAKDPHGRYAPASTLKALTALALLPRLDPARPITPTEADVGVDGSKVGLVPELSYTAADLFTAMLVVSGNDAAGALSTAAGGQEATAGLMNAEAERLQAHDTHAVNPSGLDADGQASSAYDLALIARAGMARPDFRAYVATRRSFIPAPGGSTIEIGNHNRLLYGYEGALGIKNGYTEAARASFVGAASRDGRTLVASMMRAEPNIWPEATALLDWGFAASAAGAQPIGRLVEPAPPGTTADRPSRADRPDGAATDATASSVSAPATSTRSLALPVAAGLLLVLLVLLRRRAVVRARGRRRAANRRPPPGAAPSHVRPVPR